MDSRWTRAAAVSACDHIGVVGRHVELLAGVDVQMEQLRCGVLRAGLAPAVGPARDEVGLPRALAKGHELVVSPVGERPSCARGPLKQRRTEIDAVEWAVAREGRPGDRGDRRDEVEVRPHLRHDGRGDPTRRPEDAGDADASLPRARLPVAKQARGTAMLVVQPPGAVVAGEHHDGAPVQARPPEHVDQSPDVGVEFLDDVTVHARRASPFERLRTEQRHVRHRMGEVEEEGSTAGWPRRSGWPRR